MKEQIQESIKDAGFLGCEIEINDYGYITVSYRDIGLNRDEADEALAVLENVTGLPFSWYVRCEKEVGNKILVEFRSLDHIR